MIATLLRRDLKKALSLRSWCIWLALAAMGVFFFFTTGGKTRLLESGKIEFMALFLPHMIFGSWAILSVYFDTVSSDREHNVLDCILCSGASKAKVFLAKVLAAALSALALSAIYLTPVTGVIVLLSGDLTQFAVLFRYLLPLWGYIMVFASIGIAISILARSSKAALIWSLAIGLLFMPRLFVMLLEGVGQAVGWSAEMVNCISLLSPGIMMQALSDASNASGFGTAASLFSVSVLVLCGLAYVVFSKQDELNYGG